MKKYLIVVLSFLFATSFANNLPIIKVESDVKIKEALNNLNNQFTSHAVPVMSEPFLLKNNNSDIKVVENLVNKDIGLTITNQTNEIINITSVSYLVDRATCAANNKLNTKILAKSKIYNFFIARNEELKCYESIKNSTLDQIGGNYVLNDVAPNVDPYQFHYAMKGLFLYPIEISIKYQIGNNSGIKNIFTFLVYQRT